jgi:uncharacterized protein involved in exopolysaccharide biosynthesis
LRYTPRIYQSSSTLLFNSEKKNELLGIEKIAVEQDNAAINREIQLLKSPLLLSRVVDSLPLKVTYFREGKTKFISTELYQTCPFPLDLEIKDGAISQYPIYIKLLDQN